MNFDLLLYASSSLKLTKHLLRYWIDLATVYLHFYLLNFDIRRIFNVLRSSSSTPTPFLQKLVLKMFLLCLNFHETFFPVYGESNF